MTPDELPLATLEYERFALSLFRLELAPEEFAARHGHEFATFSFDQYRYRRPGMTEWIRQLGTIFFAPDLPARLRQLRERFLSPEEIRSVEAYERDPF